MAPRKLTSEIKQAVKLLEVMSEAKRAAVLRLIRVMSEDEVDEDADLHADEAAVREDLECFARVDAGDYSQTVPLSTVEERLERRRVREPAHV